MAMRDACFRGKRIQRPGWEKNIGEWVEGGIAYDPGGTYITQWNSYGMGFIDCIPVDPATVGQFTGTCDKNGGRIFEGDIVRMRSYGVGFHTATVYFKGGKFAVDGSNYHFKDLAPSTYEVIGNIHDNLNLVEREEREDG
jgi:hypothetical protein